MAGFYMLNEIVLALLNFAILSLGQIEHFTLLIACVCMCLSFCHSLVHDLCHFLVIFI